MTLFAIAGLFAPVIGPTLGGYLTVFYNWRWIFFINLPIGALAFLACSAVLEDPDYLRQQRAKMLSRPLNFDYIGLGLLAVAVSCWEVRLSKGQELDWLNDPFLRIHGLVAAVVLALILLVLR